MGETDSEESNGSISLVDSESFASFVNSVRQDLGNKFVVE